ncbi:MAG: hypothetical protein M4D80_38095 [Myxococcota bacterium]|nr:hypothetical protein [Myxococcota bacterium]
MRWLLVVFAFACRTEAREPAAAVTPAEGLAIAIYSNGERAYGVVDDRRTIEVAGNTVFLDRIDPASALQSLVIEPLGADPIHIISCVRERVDDSAAALAQLAEARGERKRRVIVLNDRHNNPTGDPFRFEDTNAMEPAIRPSPSVLSPIVRCRVKARAGKHLVRVMHVTSTLSFDTQHDLTMTAADRAHVTTRFAIATPTWRSRATVTLFDGIPGDKTPPVELARAPIVLDGSTAIIASSPRELPARLRSVYDGTKLEDGDDVKPSDIVWGRESRHQVWVWLELSDASARLARGPLRAHLALPDAPIRDRSIAADLRVRTPEHTRYPLHVDEDLLGTRKRTIERADGVMITDRIALTVANLSAHPREVWVEERLRTAKRRSLAQSWPSRPTFSKDIARTKLTLAPNQTQRLGFTIDYEF